MLSKRQCQIIHHLHEHVQGLTGKDLSNFLNVSSRTIRNDIRTMEDELRISGAVIHSDTRRGYRLDVQDEAALEQCMKNAGNSAMNNSDNRVDYIIRRFFECTLADTSLTQSALADELFISLSTLKNDMKEANRKLNPYGLKISTYRIEGMRISGDEAQIRNFISQYVFLRKEQIRQEQAVFFQKLFPDIDFEMLLDIIIRVSDSYEVHLTDVAIHNLVIHTAIAMERAQKGHAMVYTMRQTRNIEKTREYEVASAVFDEIFRKKGIDVATSEIYYLAQHIMASKKYMDADEADFQHMDQLVSQILKAVKMHVNLDFSQDKILIGWLAMHLKTAIPRMKFHMSIRNDALDIIKSEYPLAFQVAVVASRTIEQMEQITVNENEIGYIAIHFGAALNRLDMKHDMCIRRALVVCASGMGTALLLKTRLEEYFKDRIVIAGTVPGYKLNQAVIDDVDMILTTVPIEQIHSDKIVRIHHLLNNEELMAIEDRFFLHRHDMVSEIMDFFRPDCFYTSVPFKTREEILDFMTGKLIQKGLMTAEEKASVFEREAASSTEIGNLVAIPHPIYGDPRESRISVLVLDKPIVWEEERVQLVFLIHIAKAQINLWQSVFLKLFNYLIKKDGVKEILKHPTYEDFIHGFVLSIKV